MNGIRRNTMKKILKIASIALIGLSLSNVSNAWMIQSYPNGLGGYNYHDLGSGSFWQSSPNGLGGYNFFEIW